MSFGMWGQCEICGFQIRADDTCFLKYSETEKNKIVEMFCIDCGSKNKAGD